MRKFTQQEKDLFVLSVWKSHSIFIQSVTPNSICHLPIESKNQNMLEEITIIKNTTDKENMHIGIILTEFSANQG